MQGINENINTHVFDFLFGFFIFPIFLIFFIWVANNFIGCFAELLIFTLDLLVRVTLYENGRMENGQV